MAAAALGAFVVFEDEAGFSMTPPSARTWSRRGHTPVVRVRGRSWRRWSIAAMCCYRPGESSRLIYRPRRHRKHGDKGRDTFVWSDYRDLVVRAHIQLSAHRPGMGKPQHPPGRRDARVRRRTRLAHHRATSFLRTRLESGRGHLVAVTTRPLANVAFTDDEHLERTLRRGLRHIQLRPDLIDGCLAGTRLTRTQRPTTTRGLQ